MSRPAGISGSLPFRLGTTSYILHDDILPNVEYLKDKVDDIELVLFESAIESDIPSPDVIGKLASYAKDWNLTYTVHLPYDVRAGSADEKERRHAVETWIKVIERTKSLPVHAFIAHLNPEKCDGPSDVDKWMTRLEKTLDELKSGAQDMVDTSLICIENLKYDIGLLIPMILDHGFGLALDVGHLWKTGLYDSESVADMLPFSRVVHLHGVSDGKDHQALDRTDRDELVEFLDLLGQFRGSDIVVTLEVFSESDLKDSLALLRKMGAF